MQYATQTQLDTVVVSFALQDCNDNRAGEEKCGRFGTRPASSKVAFGPNCPSRPNLFLDLQLRVGIGTRVEVMTLDA